VSDESLTAANVQRILQGTLDAANELMTEFISKKRAAKWDVINDGMYAAERLCAELSERLRAVGVEPTKSRSK
jgi:hypothetical protein